MSKKRGTSIVPMLMGIIGAVMQLPGALCAGACAVGLDSMSGKGSSAAQGTGNTFLAIGLISALIGFVCGLFGKKSPVFAGIGLLLAAVLAGITLVTFNFFSLIALILFLIGGIMAFAQKKEELQA